MSSPMITPTASPKRRALHERSPSENNEGRRRSPVRVVKEESDGSPHGVSPYPTKPSQFLPPKPGKGQTYLSQDAFGISNASLVSTDTDQTVTGSRLPWERSSSEDVGQSSSQVWENDPSSSMSSFPTPQLADDGINETVTDKQHQRPEDQDKNEDDYDGDIIVDNSNSVLRTVRSAVATEAAKSTSRGSASVDEFTSTVKLVSPDPSVSSNATPPEAPSSPNVISLQSSSPNLVQLGSSSPEIAAEVGSGLSTGSSSLNSVGTVIRTHVDAPSWPGLAVEVGQSHMDSLQSGLPEHIAHLYQSISSLVRAGSSRSHSDTTSTGSFNSMTEAQIVSRNTLVQYPRIRPPSSSGSFANSSSQPFELQRPSRALVDRPGSHRGTRLSTVPSLFSDEQGAEMPSTRVEAERNHSRGNSDSSGSVGDRAAHTEEFDRVSNLPQPSLRHWASIRRGSQSLESRSSNSESLRRTGSNSSSSVILNTLPNWVRFYYRNYDSDGPNPALLAFDSRPSTAASRPDTASRYISKTPGSSGTISRPRTRARGNSRPSQMPGLPSDNDNPATQTSHMPSDNPTSQTPRMPSDNPVDPRAHWKQEPGQASETTLEDNRPLMRQAWSPHLHPDKHVMNQPVFWTPPSVDSRIEPLFGRRNVQKYAFCLGFLFPPGKGLTYSATFYCSSRLVWFIAAFLKIPPKPSVDDESMVAGPGIATRIREHELKRHHNARWWRNVNRVMVPIGVVFLSIIVSLHTSMEIRTILTVL